MKPRQRRAMHSRVTPRGAPTLTGIEVLAPVDLGHPVRLHLLHHLHSGHIIIQVRLPPHRSALVKVWSVLCAPITGHTHLRPQLGFPYPPPPGHCSRASSAYRRGPVPPHTVLASRLPCRAPTLRLRVQERASSDVPRRPGGPFSSLLPGGLASPGSGAPLPATQR